MHPQTILLTGGTFSQALAAATAMRTDTDLCPPPSCAKTLPCPPPACALSTVYACPDAMDTAAHSETVPSRRLATEAA